MKFYIKLFNPVIVCFFLEIAVLLVFYSKFNNIKALLGWWWQVYILKKVSRKTFFILQRPMKSSGLGVTDNKGKQRAKHRT